MLMFLAGCVVGVVLAVALCMWAFTPEPDYTERHL